MRDDVLAYLFLALCADLFAWVLLVRAIGRRLQARHPARHAALFGTPARRKNGLDRFFALLAFLFQADHAALGDSRLRVQGLAFKLASALLPLIFLAMMFGPFFLRLGH